MVAITGKTFAAKELLKDFGAKWDGNARAWMMTSEQWAELKAKVTPTYSRTLSRLVSDLVASPMSPEARHDAIYNEGGEGYNPHR